MTRFLRDVFAQAGRLGLTPLERFVLILGTAVLMVGGRRAWDALRSIHLVVEYPGPIDEGGPLPPGAGGPSAAEPGGGSTGGMG